MSEAAPVRPPARVVIVMGVSGVGKTMVGAALARRWGSVFVDADDFHSSANVAKMAAGIPLADADRISWFHRIAERLVGLQAEGRNAVLACSALGRWFRERLRAIAPDRLFVLLTAERDVIERRLAMRQGHFMPPALLASQLEALEWPTSEPDMLVTDASGPVRDTIGAVLARVGNRSCRW